MIARRRRRTAFLYALALAVAFVLWALTGAVKAQDAPTSASPSDPCSELRAATQELEAQPTRLALEEVAGLWFPSPIARLMLCEVRELRVRRREVRLDAREIRLWEREVGFADRQLELAVAARDTLEEVVDDSDRRAREAEAELGAWYRSPILWVIVGIAIAVFGIVGGVYLAAAAIP